MKECSFKPKLLGRKMSESTEVQKVKIHFDGDKMFAEQIKWKKDVKDKAISKELISTQTQARRRQTSSQSSFTKPKYHSKGEKSLNNVISMGSTPRKTISTKVNRSACNSKSNLSMQ